MRSRAKATMRYHTNNKFTMPSGGDLAEVEAKSGGDRSAVVGRRKGAANDRWRPSSCGPGPVSQPSR